MKIIDCPFVIIRHYSYEGISIYHSCYANYLKSCYNKPEVTKEQFDQMTFEEKQKLELFNEFEGIENIREIGGVEDDGYLPIKDFVKSFLEHKCPLEKAEQKTKEEAE